VDIDPFKHTLSDLEYFILDLKCRGYEIVIVIDVNEAEDINARPQPYLQRFQPTSGFHIYGSIDGSLKTFIANFRLIDEAAIKHPEQPVAHAFFGRFQP
jgi:hypothetical protein